MKTTIAFTLNGEAKSVTTFPDRTLLDVLREEYDLTGTKYGCGEGSCRSCTTLVNGRPKASCQELISDIAGKDVVTIEGFSAGSGPNPLQQAFVAENAMQCGYCVPGMILTAAALLEHNTNPSHDEIVEWMDGNLCRCCNYPNIIRAVERAAKGGAA